MNNISFLCAVNTVQSARAFLQVHGNTKLGCARLVQAEERLLGFMRYLGIHRRWNMHQVDVMCGLCVVVDHLVQTGPFNTTLLTLYRHLLLALWTGDQIQVLRAKVAIQVVECDDSVFHFHAKGFCDMFIEYCV